MKINPPFPDFMQNGIKSDMVDLTGKSDEPKDEDFSNISEPNKEEFPKNNQKCSAIKPVYKIQSLFWLLNPKLHTDAELEINEAAFCTINFNIEFGNLRIELYNIDKENAIKKNIIFLSELTKLIDCVIYPTNCFEIANSDNINIYPMENLVKFTNEDWQNKRPISHIIKNKDGIKLTISTTDFEKSYHYNFIEQQKDIFNYCCRYAVTTGFQLVGYNKI